MPAPVGRFRIILVRPKYEMNIGAVARAMKNFGFSELYIVSPECDPLGFDAIKYSKHARDILESAKICKTFAQAKKGCKLTVGTTGILYRHWDDTFRSPITLKQLSGKLGKSKEGRVAVAFGHEGIGLTLDDINQCDFLITIPTHYKYPVLNLSHAVAIVLYELSNLNYKTYEPVAEAQKEQMIKAFSLLVDKFKLVMRNPEKVKIAFRRMAGKSMLSDKECVSILGVLRRANSKLKTQTRK